MIHRGRPSRDMFSRCDSMIFYSIDRHKGSSLLNPDSIVACTYQAVVLHEVVPLRHLPMIDMNIDTLAIIPLILLLISIFQSPRQRWNVQ